MRGFQPAKAKAKAQPFANGGPVRGPGTGTSDDVKDVVRNGWNQLGCERRRKRKCGHKRQYI